MINENKLVVIGVGTTIGRSLMGIGCELFVHTVAKHLTQGCSFPKKAGIWATSYCAAWALGHAVDCYWDKTCKSLIEMTGVLNASDVAKNDLENILEEMET